MSIKITKNNKSTTNDLLVSDTDCATRLCILNFNLGTRKCLVNKGCRIVEPHNVSQRFFG